MGVKGIVNRLDAINFNNKYTDNINLTRENSKVSPTQEGRTERNNDNAYSEEELIKTIEEANKEVILYGRRFEFSIHQETKQIMVKVIDAATDEVIREIPPEKILDLVAALWKISGLIVDERV